MGRAHGCAGAPQQWLLRFFDQIRFYPVGAEELLELRSDFPFGKFNLRIEPAVLRLRDYRNFLRDHEPSIRAFKMRQQTAFEAERERWRANGQLAFAAEAQIEPPQSTVTPIPDECDAVLAPVAGSVWQINVQTGQRVTEGEELMVIEAMKMEMPILADSAGEIVEIRCERANPVAAGDVLMVVRR